MDNNYFLSIIVPIYNVEKYIGECIESIINQKDINFELILINDGSTDNSLEICKKYKKKYQNIVLINQENKGVSYTRNHGIDIAKGKYIMFVDSDDLLYNKCNLAKIKKNIENLNLDIIMYNMIYMYEYDNRKKFDFLPNYPKINTDNIIDALLNSNKLSISSCDKLVKRDFIISNNIYFDKKKKNLEDADWSLNLYLHTSKIKYINEYVYIYRKQREGSATTKHNANIVEQQVSFIKSWESNEGSPCLTKKQIKQYLSYQYLITIGNIQKYKLQHKYKMFIINYKKLLKYGKNKKIKIALYLSNFLGMKITMNLLGKYIEFREKGKRLL